MHLKQVRVKAVSVLSGSNDIQKQWEEYYLENDNFAKDLYNAYSNWVENVI